MTKTLIISPHVDDEVLGCGGILEEDSFVYFCGIDESKVTLDKNHRIPSCEREEEIIKVAQFLGYKYEINYKSKVNHYEITEFIANIEKVINSNMPEYIFIPHSGYNQDHQTIFNACQVALRPHDKNFFVKKVLVYEAIHDFLWSFNRFDPNYFVPIDINKKSKAYSLHKSQVRTFRSHKMLEELAKLRGAMSNCEFADAFQILRWVEDKRDD